MMLWGLERLSGVLTSLRLSLESLCTVLIVREHVARLELAGVLSIFASLARILPAVRK
jgi:hypothetical protein